MSKFYYNQEQESYDAIVVGTGISGGWAGKGTLRERPKKPWCLKEAAW